MAQPAIRCAVALLAAALLAAVLLVALPERYCDFQTPGATGCLQPVHPEHWRTSRQWHPANSGMGLLATALGAGTGAGPDAPAPAAADALAPDPMRALLDEGWQEMHFANWPKAQDLLEQARDKASRPANRAEALYALGNLWQIRQPGADAPLARRLYERIVGEFAETMVAPWAHLALARLADNPEYESDRDVELARKPYTEILRLYPDHPTADEAALRLAMTYLEKIGDAASEDTGKAILEKHLAARPKNYLAAPMHMQLGGLEQRRERYREAVAHWTAADEAGIPSLGDRANLYFLLGRVAENRLKDYPLAARWNEKLVTDVGRDNPYFVAKMAAERCRKRAAEAAAAAPGESAP